MSISRAESNRIAQAKYRQRHREKAAMWSNNRKFRLREATPDALTDSHHDAIEAFYELARELTAVTGVLHVVDHIMPLQGKGFAGLHVPWNLQVVTAQENLRKSNRVISRS